MLFRTAASRVRVPAGEEKGGEEEQVVEGVVLCLQGGPWSEEGAGEATGARRPWRQCFSWRHSEGRDDRWVPLSGIFLFLFPEIPVGF